MATAYTSTRGGTGASAKARTGSCRDYCEFVVPAAGFIINDTVKLFKLPAMARLMEFAISLPILDTNGTPLARASVGDTQNGAGQYVLTANLGTGFSTAVDIVFPSAQSGVVQGVMGIRYTADDALVLKITTAPATAAVTGTIRAWVTYEMDGGTSAGL